MPFKHGLFFKRTMLPKKINFKMLDELGGDYAVVFLEQLNARQSRHKLLTIDKYKQMIDRHRAKYCLMSRKTMGFIHEKIGGFFMRILRMPMFGENAPDTEVFGMFNACVLKYVDEMNCGEVLLMDENFKNKVNVKLY